MNERTFKVGKSILEDSKHKTCPVCEKDFKEGEEIVLAAIQKPKSGWASVMALPVHKDCYIVDD